MTNEKYEPGPHKVFFDGEIIGEAILDEDGKVVSASLFAEGVKKVMPDYDPTEGLSIYEEVERVDVVSAYPEWDVEMTEAYYKNRPKVPFDA
jgi:hypothetical protein